MAGPGLWKRVPGYLLDPLGPLTIRWVDFAALTPWAGSFPAFRVTAEKVRRTARVLSQLLRDAPARHRKVAEEAGYTELIQSRGLICTFADTRSYEADALSWRIREENGVKIISKLDRKALGNLVPCLSEKYSFGLLVAEGAHCLNPGGYVDAIVKKALASGAALKRMAAAGFAFEGKQLVGVATPQGLVTC
jgi:D-amino-acid dehydrogenase